METSVKSSGAGKPVVKPFKVRRPSKAVMLKRMYALEAAIRLTHWARLNKPTGLWESSLMPWKNARVQLQNMRARYGSAYQVEKANDNSK